MECAPAVRVVVEKLAPPELLRACPAAMVFVPSLKFTVPVGVPPEDAETVAVKVTDCPTAEGFSEEITVVLLALPGICRV